MGSLGGSRRWRSRSWYAKPVYYKGNHLAISGPGDTIRWPGSTRQLDYEIELAVVIGTRGHDIPRSRAMDHVFGYTIFDDFSARDVLAEELMGGRMGPAKGKDFDTSNAFGPWIATADEIPHPDDLDGLVRVDGEVRARVHTRDMHHDIPSMIEEASRTETLHPGELLGTGC